jgi:Leu/Phe-tRNA-protein transferase
MSFVKEFDPKNETHVTWLKNIDIAMVEMNDLSKSKDLMKIVNENPFGIKMNNPMDWAQSHFQLCMKYSQAVLRGVAHIPTQGPAN